MSAETVSLQLPTPLYTDLQALATREQLDPVEMIARWVRLARQRREAQSPTLAFQHILEIATDLGVADLAEQHDHYLYGVAKQ